MITISKQKGKYCSFFYSKIEFWIGFMLTFYLCFKPKRSFKVHANLFNIKKASYIYYVINGYEEINKIKTKALKDQKDKTK